MKHMEYLSLPAEIQAITLRKFGTRVAVIKTPVFYHVLYQIDAFYIECKFLRGTDEPLTINSFSSTLALEQYLKYIDISTLLSDCNIGLSSKAD